jgi:hypothetical protein
MVHNTPPIWWHCHTGVSCFMCDGWICGYCVEATPPVSRCRFCLTWYDSMIALSATQNPFTTPSRPNFSFLFLSHLSFLFISHRPCRAMCGLASAILCCTVVDVCDCFCRTICNARCGIMRGEAAIEPRPHVYAPRFCCNYCFGYCFDLTCFTQAGHHTRTAKHASSLDHSHTPGYEIPEYEKISCLRCCFLACCTVWIQDPKTDEFIMGRQ